MSDQEYLTKVLFWRVKIDDQIAATYDESVHQEEDGAVRFDDMTSIFRSEIDGTSHWSIRAWISFLAKRRKAKEKVSVLLEP